MKTFIQAIFSVLFCMLTLAATSCDNSKHSAINLGPSEEDFDPNSFSFVNDDQVNVLSNTNLLVEKNVAHAMSLVAEEKYTKAGTEGMNALESLTKSAAPVVTFRYSYDVNNKLTVEGLTMTYIYKGQSYTLYCADDLVIRGNHEVISSAAVPFNEESKTTYQLVAINKATKAEIVVATVEQEFAVVEDYVEPVLEKVVLVSSHHKAFDPQAVVENNQLTAKGVNIADIELVYITGNTKQVSLDYALEHHFNLTTGKIVVDDKKDVIGKTYNVAADGSVVIAGTKFVFEYCNCEVSPVVYEGEDFTDKVKRCAPKARTMTIKSASEAEVCLYENDKNDCAMASFTISVEEKEKPATLVSINDVFNHKAFRAAATVNGNVLSVICDNNHVGTANYSDNTTKQAASINYTWTNKFKVEVPAMEVASKAALYGQTYNLTNGEVVVEGYTIKVTFTGRQISEIKYTFEGKTYDVTSKAPVCEATAKSIRFNADGTMTVVFDGEGEKAEGSVPVTITEKVEAIELEGEIVAGYATDSYWDHVSSIEGTYQHIITRLANGAYKHYSRKEGDKNFKVADLTSAQGQNLLSQNRAFAWYRAGNEYLLGTVEGKEFDDKKDHYLLNYYTMNGALAYRLGIGEETIGKSFRYPVRSTLTKTAKGWTFGGNEYFK